MKKTDIDALEKVQVKEDGFAPFEKICKQSPKRVQVYVNKWRRLLSTFGDYSGSNNLEMNIEIWNDIYPDMKTSVQSFYRNKRKYKKLGWAGFFHQDQSRTSVRDRWLADYIGELKKGKSGAVAHKIALDKAIENGECVDRFPSLSAFSRRLNKEKHTMREIKVLHEMEQRKPLTQEEIAQLREIIEERKSKQAAG